MRVLSAGSGGCATNLSSTRPLAQVTTCHDRTVGAGEVDDNQRGETLLHLLGAIWVGKFDQGWQAAVKGSWREGYYDSRATAVEAARQFTDNQLRSLRHIWSADSESRPITMDDLEELSRSLPFPWYWRFRWPRHMVLWLDQVLPEWAKPWVTREF